MSLATIQARVDQLSKVPTEIVSQTAASDRDACISGALLRYNADRPRRLKVVIAATGGSTWEYSMSVAVSGWNEGQYCVTDVLYPGGERTEAPFDRNDWTVYKRADATFWLRFVRNAPSSGYNMWVCYTAPHTLSGAADTITSDYPNDVEAFCNLAASIVLREAANHYTKIALSSLSLDNVDYRGLSDYAARRAKETLAVYEAAVSVARGPKSAFVDWDSATTDDHDFLFWQGGQS